MTEYQPGQQKLTEAGGPQLHPTGCDHVTQSLKPCLGFHSVSNRLTNRIS
jgi:hypothetical protein